MSKRDCETADWLELGYRDSSKGWSMDSFNTRKKDCSEWGTNADKDKYTAGFTAGLKKFCTYDQGVEFGHRSGHYRNQCPSDLEVEFLKGYRLGKAESERDALKKELDEKEEEEARKLNGG